MKRRISLLLAVVMILGSFSFAFAANDEVKPAEFLEKQGVLKGNAKGDLMLDEALLRRDAVVLLSRLMNAEEEAKGFKKEGFPTFKDITDNHYVGYLAWAQSNEYIKGHDDKGERFGFNDNLTTREYSTVLLRALGYVEEAKDWDKVFETAKKLGLLEKVEKEADAEITRADMAQMTFNALGAKMKDSDKTLAEFLGIEMPVEKPEKAEAKVYTENLKEVVVELNDASLVDKAKLEDVRNYRITGQTFKFAKAELKDNKVTLLIADDEDVDGNKVQRDLVEGKKYSLLVRNIDKDINKTYGFTAKDNTIPAVVDVKSLGDYGIRVTTTEPVKNPKERNFLIDGKNVAMIVEQYGREIILTPYHKQAFPEDAKTLTVKELEDFAKFKSASEDIEFEMIKDDKGPEVVSVTSTGKEVTVVFDKDVYHDSIKYYRGIKVPGNISYIEGRHPIYATGAKKVDTNKVVYTFKEELPRRAQVTIEGVQNHSKVAMEKVTVDVVEIIDNTEPEIINKVVYDTTANGKDNSEAVLRLYFDKDVTGVFLKDNDGNIEKNADGEELFDVKKHFTVYQREVLGRNIVENAKLEATYLGSRKDVIKVTITGLSQNNLDGDYDYILEIVDFRDINNERNKMYRDYMDFDIWPGASAFKVLDVVVRDITSAKAEITIEFNKAVDRVIAEDPTNYIFQASWGKLDVDELGGDITVESNGKEVTLTIPEFRGYSFNSLRILDVLKDKDDNRLSKTYTFEFDKIFEGLAARARKAEADAVKLGLQASEEYLALMAFDTELTGDARYTKVSYSKHYEFVTAIEKLEKVIKEADKTLGKDLDAAKKALRELLVEAKGVYAKLEDKTSQTSAAPALAVEIANTEALLAKEDAILTDIGATETTGQRGALKAKLDLAKIQLGQENVTGVGISNQVVEEGKDQTIAVPAAPATPVKVTVTISGTATDGETVTLKLGDVELAEATLAANDNVAAIANKLATGVKSGYTVDKTDVATGKLVFTAEIAGLTNYQNSDVTIAESTSSVTASGTVVNGTDKVDEAIVPAKKAKVTFDVTVSYTDGKTKVGKVKVSLAGKDVEVEIPAGKTAAEVAELIATAVNADADFGYTATVSGAAVTFEAKVAGATSLGANPVTIAEVQ